MTAVAQPLAPVYWDNNVFLAAVTAFNQLLVAQCSVPTSVSVRDRTETLLKGHGLNIMPQGSFDRHFKRIHSSEKKMETAIKEWNTTDGFDGGHMDIDNVDVAEEFDLVASRGLPRIYRELVKGELFDNFMNSQYRAMSRTQPGDVNLFLRDRMIAIMDGMRIFVDPNNPQMRQLMAWGVSDMTVIIEKLVTNRIWYPVSGKKKFNLCLFTKQFLSYKIGQIKSISNTLVRIANTFCFHSMNVEYAEANTVNAEWIPSMLSCNTFVSEWRFRPKNPLLFACGLLLFLNALGFAYYDDSTWTITLCRGLRGCNLTRYSFLQDGGSTKSWEDSIKDDSTPRIGHPTQCHIRFVDDNDYKRVKKSICHQIAFRGQ